LHRFNRIEPALQVSLFRLGLRVCDVWHAEVEVRQVGAQAHRAGQRLAAVQHTSERLTARNLRLGLIGVPRHDGRVVRRPQHSLRWVFTHQERLKATVGARLRLRHIEQRGHITVVGELVQRPCGAQHQAHVALRRILGVAL
jgi:hypothetical protein